MEDFLRDGTYNMICGKAMGSQFEKTGIQRWPSCNSISSLNNESNRHSSVINFKRQYRPRQQQAPHSGDRAMNNNEKYQYRDSVNDSSSSTVRTSHHDHHQSRILCKRTGHKKHAASYSRSEKTTGRRQEEASTTLLRAGIAASSSRKLSNASAKSLEPNHENEEFLNYACPDRNNKSGIGREDTTCTTSPINQRVSTATMGGMGFLRHSIRVGPLGWNQVSAAGTGEIKTINNAVGLVGSTKQQLLPDSMTRSMTVTVDSSPEKYGEGISGSVRTP